MAGSSHRDQPLPRTILSSLLLLVAFSGPVAAQRKAGTAQRLPSADKIIDNYLKVIGGKKRAQAIRESTSEWTVKQQDQEQGLARIQLQQPNARRTEMTFGNGKIISAANSRSAWVNGLDGQLHTLTGAEAAAAKLQAALDATHLMDYRKANIMARVTSTVDTPIGPAYAIEFSARSGGRLRYLFGSTSKLLLAIEDEARKTTTWFDDYRAEGTILEPHLLRMNVDGAGELRLTLNRVTYNTNLNPAVFDPPRSVETLDVAGLLREVSKNQDEVEKHFTEYSFVQKETDREFDSHGVVKKETVRVSEVFPVPNRQPIEKLISENGVPLSPERAAKEEKRVQEEFEKAERDKDKDAKKAEDRKVERERKRAAKGDAESDDDEVEISGFLKVCEFVSPRHEQFQNRDSIVFDFRVKPGFKPSTRTESLVAKLVGVVWIDPVDKQVIRLEARLAEGFKMGGGLVLSLRPGAALLMEQTRMNEGVWLPRLAQLNLSLKVLLFGGGDVNKTIEWSDYKHFSADVTGYKISTPDNSDPARKKPF